MPTLYTRFYSPADQGPNHERYLWFELVGTTRQWLNASNSLVTSPPAGRLVTILPATGVYDLAISGVPAGTYYVESRMIDDPTVPPVERAVAVVPPGS